MAPSPQTELHRHLEISARLSTVLELAQAQGFEAQSTSLARFSERFVMRKPLRDLTEVLANFTLFQKILDRPETLERIAFEVVEDCHAEGTRAVELRYAPQFASGHGELSWEDCLDGFERGIKRALRRHPDMRAGLVCIALRDFGAEEADRAVEFYLNNKKHFIGVDLAGNEAGFPCRLFESSFRRAKADGARITIHAGEATGPENIWEAIDLLGAERIGHGITCVQDPALMRALAERGICLEMCPTSNWLTSAVDRIENHPLPRALRAGIPVSINTDDPTIFGVTLTEELKNCREKMGLSPLEIEACQAHASRASFL